MKNDIRDRLTDAFGIPDPVRKDEFFSRLEEAQKEREDSDKMALLFTFNDTDGSEKKQSKLTMVMKIGSIAAAAAAAFTIWVTGKATPDMVQNHHQHPDYITETEYTTGTETTAAPEEIIPTEADEKPVTSPAGTEPATNGGKSTKPAVTTGTAPHTTAASAESSKTQAAQNTDTQETAAASPAPSSPSSPETRPSAGSTRANGHSAAATTSVSEKTARVTTTTVSERSARATTSAASESTAPRPASTQTKPVVTTTQTTPRATSKPKPIDDYPVTTFNDGIEECTTSPYLEYTNAPDTGYSYETSIVQPEHDTTPAGPSYPPDWNVPAPTMPAATHIPPPSTTPVPTQPAAEESAAYTIVPGPVPTTPAPVNGDPSAAAPIETRSVHNGDYYYDPEEKIGFPENYVNASELFGDTYNPDNWIGQSVYTFLRNYLPEYAFIGKVESVYTVIDPYSPDSFYIVENVSVIRPLRGECERGDKCSVRSYGLDRFDPDYYSSDMDYYRQAYPGTPLLDYFRGGTYIGPDDLYVINDYGIRKMPIAGDICLFLVDGNSGDSFLTYTTGVQSSRFTLNNGVYTNDFYPDYRLTGREINEFFRNLY